jgi:hypothetical protein
MAYNLTDCRLLRVKNGFLYEREIVSSCRGLDQSHIFRACDRVLRRQDYNSCAMEHKSHAMDHDLLYIYGELPSVESSQLTTPPARSYSYSSVISYGDEKSRGGQRRSACCSLKCPRAVEFNPSCAKFKPFEAIFKPLGPNASQWKPNWKPLEAK